MTPFDLTGWAATSLTLLAFTSSDLHLLRIASIGASLCFITYGAQSGLWPVMALHTVLLPVNLLRLRELRACSRGKRGTPQLCGHGPATAACEIVGKPSQVCGPLRRFTLMALLLVGGAMPAGAATTYAERMHARAVESFRLGRFPEAYGRFIDLANAGHPASARYELFMCEQGLVLFGKDWDCAPHEAEDWARTAGVALPRITVSQPVTPINSPRHGRR